MNKRQVKKEIARIAEEHNICVSFNDENCNKNMASSTNNCIFLGEFDDNDIELFAFFHELGHCTFPSKATYHMSTLSNEGAAWEYGISLAAKYEYKYDYNSKEFKYGRKQLATYLKSEIIKELRYHEI